MSKSKWEDVVKAYKEGTPIYWNDPDPIKGNDYKISFLEELDEAPDADYPILIEYNKGVSEAEVYLHEILINKK